MAAPALTAPIEKRSNRPNTSRAARVLASHAMLDLFQDTGERSSRTPSFALDSCLLPPPVVIIVQRRELTDMRQHIGRGNGSTGECAQHGPVGFGNLDAVCRQILEHARDCQCLFIAIHFAWLRDYLV